MIRFEQVSKYYPGGLIGLKQINFTLNHGEMIFLTGHSGAGKSTLLKLIAMFEVPSTGQIIVNGSYLNTITKKQIAAYRSNLGLIFQSPYLLPDRTIFENVALPLQIQGLSTLMINKRVHAALEMVSLWHKNKALPSHLSAGEQQRVSIARAVVHKPQLLLADEPTGNLDPLLALEIMNIFKQFNNAGVSIIIATHDLGLVAGAGQRIIMLKDGLLLH